MTKNEKFNKIIDDAYEQYRLSASKMEFENWLIKNPIGLSYFKKLKKLRYTKKSK